MGHPSSPSLNEPFKGFQFIRTNGCTSYYLLSVEHMDSSPQHTEVQLSRTTQGSPTDLRTTYYYTPYGMALFFVTLHLSYVTAENQQLCVVDYHVHDDRITVTSTAHTECSSAFRQNIVNRDQFCVLTGGRADFCDAAHIIPMKKGSAVRSFLKSLM